MQPVFPEIKLSFPTTRRRRNERYDQHVDVKADGVSGVGVEVVELSEHGPADGGGGGGGKPESGGC